MSFPRYPKYKVSDVEWLGDVPEGWGYAPLKYLAEIQSGHAFSSDDFVDEGIPVLRIGDITAEGKIDFKDARCLPSKYKAEHLDVLVARGDIVMAMTGATIGKAGWYATDQPALLNQRVCIFRALAPNSQLYLWYILGARFYSEHIALTAFGGAQPNISDTQLLQSVVPLPPVSEQIAIAEFLDRETAKIDELVAEQRRMMELLKEKRQAIISHAVTKGLNPHANMKPSGIEWLGDVPEHWEVAKTSHYFKVAMGQTILAEDLIEHGEWPVFSATEGDHYFGRVNDPKVRLNAGDMVIPARGNSIGNVKLVEEPATTTQTTIYCKSLAPEKLNARFVYQYFRGCKESLFYFTQTAIPQITVREVNSNAIVIPPLPEQTAIAEFLDTELTKFDTLTDEAQRAIDLLQERRTALISAAVTGQIDVRQQQRN